MYHSTTISIRYYISKRIEEGLDTDIIYLDFQKTFDKVPHSALKLEAARVSGDLFINA